MADDVRPAGPQALVEQAYLAGLERQLVVPDRELAARIAQQVAEAFAEGMRQGEAAIAAAADEPEPDGLVVATNIRTIGPGDEQARRLRWID